MTSDVSRSLDISWQEADPSPERAERAERRTRHIKGPGDSHVYHTWRHAQPHRHSASTSQWDWDWDIPVTPASTRTLGRCPPAGRRNGALRRSARSALLSRDGRGTGTTS